MGTVTATLDKFDIIENGDNEDDALELIAEELIEYANEYQDNFNLYFNSPNRQKTFHPTSLSICSPLLFPPLLLLI